MDHVRSRRMIARAHARGRPDVADAEAARTVHQLVRELGRAAEPADVAQIVTEVAMESLDASGAYLERAATAGTTARVVAVAGSDVPALGTSVLRSVHERVGVRRTAVVPLRTNGETLGSLVLVRAQPHPPFDDGERAWARMLADVGGFALHQCAALQRARDFHDQVMGIVEAIADPFVTLDVEGRVTYLNDTARHMGRRCFPNGDGLIGRLLWEAVPELAGVEAPFRHSIEHRDPVHFEWFSQPLGRWLEIHAYAWKHGIAAYARDVTDRKLAEVRIAESEARLRALANHLPDAAIFQAIGDGAGALRCTYVSDGIARFNAAGVAAIVQHPSTLLAELDEESQRALRDAADRARESMSPFRIEIATAGAGKDRQWYELAAEPRRGADGQLTWDGLLLDITRRKVAEEELVRANEDRARLLRGFSHDMKNPLGAAMGLVQLLEMGGQLDARQADLVGRIHGSIRSALDLIDDVLDLARAEAGSLELEVTSVDVAALVGDLVEQHRAQASIHGLTLDLAPADGPLRAVCDARRTSQVVGNLLTNALKYTPRGRVEVEIGSRSSGPLPGGPWITVGVQDTGPGIPAAEHEAIFGEFTRLADSSSVGAGVGLSIARRMARLMGGDITVEPAAEGGSLFTLWLPADLRSSRQVAS